MNATGRTIAMITIVAASIGSFGCNSTHTADSPERLDVDAAVRTHGNLSAARANWLFSQGELAERPEEARDVRQLHSYRSAGLSGIWVPEHPSTPEREIQAGWVEHQRNDAGGARWAFLDRRWNAIGYLSSDGYLIDPSGYHVWGDSRFSVLDAARALFGKGPFYAVPTSEYELSTTLAFRSGARFADEPFNRRGVTVIRRDEMVSVRPLGSGELQRMSSTLGRRTFEQREEARLTNLRADREARSGSRVPKPEEAFRSR